MNTNAINTIVTNALASAAAAEKQLKFACMLLSAITGYDVIDIQDHGVHIFCHDITCFRSMENVTLEPLTGCCFDYRIIGEQGGVRFYAFTNTKEVEEYKQGA